MWKSGSYAAWSSKRWETRWRCEGHARKATRIVTALSFPSPGSPPSCLLRRFLVHRSANERHSNGISTRSLSISLPKHFRSIRSSSKHGTNSSLLPVVTLHLDDNRNQIPSNICNFNLFCFHFLLFIFSHSLNRIFRQFFTGNIHLFLFLLWLFLPYVFIEIIFIRSKFKFENYILYADIIIYIIYINYLNGKTLNFRKFLRYD